MKAKHKRILKTLAERRAAFSEAVASVRLDGQTQCEPPRPVGRPRGPQLVKTNLTLTPAAAAILREVDRGRPLWQVVSELIERNLATK